jgi:protein SCO1/2
MYRSISTRLACLCIAIGLGLAGCTRHPPAAESGSYPASNPEDCLPALTLMDQHGKPVLLSALKGKPVLIDFVYTSCHLECPVLTAKFRMIARGLGPMLGPRVTMVSISLDPEHDSAPVLLRYARAEGAEEPGWLFLTGGSEDIEQELARFRIKRMRASDGSIGHVAAAFLLGPDGRQVRQYNVLAVSPDTVIDDIRNTLAAG